MPTDMLAAAKAVLERYDHDRSPYAHADALADAVRSRLMADLRAAVEEAERASPEAAIAGAGGTIVRWDGTRYTLYFFNGHGWETDSSVGVAATVLDDALAGRNGWRYEPPPKKGGGS